MCLQCKANFEAIISAELHEVLHEMMTTKICRVCLSTTNPLQELDIHLSDYFQEICDYAFQSAPSKYLSCNACEESLKHNLDFRDRCRNSNQILQDWEWDKSQHKRPIESLHSLLQASISSTDPEERYLKISKYEQSDGNPSYYADDDIKEEIKVELNEGINNEILEITTVSTDYDETNICIDTDDPEMHYEEEDKKTVKAKNSAKSKKSKKELKPKSEIVKKAPTKYKLRGEIAKRSEFTQYEAVFDVQLFATYAEARQELIKRRISEPYLSAPHRCEMCFTVYKCDKLLQFHMKWHDLSADLSHECDVCSMRFATRSTLLKHKPACHRGKFACKICPLVTYQRQAMKSHFQKHQGKIYKCEVCDHIFKHISSYMTHKRLTHASSHVCVTCARTFVSELGLQTHRLKMHQADSKVDHKATVRCEPCGLTFASQQVYTVHVLNTDEHKDIASELKACSVCGLAFDDTAQVKEHRRLNHPRPPKKNQKRNPNKKDGHKKKEKTGDNIECKLCGMSGGNNFWLYQHYRTAHPGARYEAASEREFLCEQCGKGFYNKTVLKEHMYVHSGLKPFRCEQCPAAFRSKQHLKLHEERHGPPSRECPHCGKKFASASNLSNHIRSHGARRYKCDVCAKGFVQFSSLREHIRGVHLQLRAPRPRRAAPPRPAATRQVNGSPFRFENDKGT